MSITDKTQHFAVMITRHPADLELVHHGQVFPQRVRRRVTARRNRK